MHSILCQARHKTKGFVVAYFDLVVVVVCFVLFALVRQLNKSTPGWIVVAISSVVTLVIVLPAIALPWHPSF